LGTHKAPRIEKKDEKGKRDASCFEVLKEGNLDLCSRGPSGKRGIRSVQRGGKKLLGRGKHNRGGVEKT